MRQPHCRVGGSERTLATPPGADDNGVVGLHGNYTVELQDAVRVRVTVRGWVDVLRMRAGASGKLLLPVDHTIVGQELPWHRPPLASSSGLPKPWLAIITPFLQRSGLDPRSKHEVFVKHLVCPAAHFC